MFKKFIAFTLAEVMLVAGITAAVAAMTVPNMKKSFDKKARISKAKAVMAKLDNALQNVDMNKALRGKANKEDWSLATLNELENYLQFRLVCGKQSSSNHCFSKNSISDSTTGIPTNFSDTVKNCGDECSTAILNDGTEIAIRIFKNIPEEVSGNLDYYGFIEIDVDGAQNGPQTRGQDVFVFGVSGTGLILLKDSMEINIFN